MRGYRLTSRIRFIAFVAVTIILFVLIFNFVFTLSTAQSETAERFYKVGIMSGDTLWSVAETYMPDMDTREAVYIIKQTNGLDSDIISAGIVLDIPVL